MVDERELSPTTFVMITNQKCQLYQNLLISIGSTGLNGKSAQRKIPVVLHFPHHRHKAGGARRKSINRSINSTSSPRGKARKEAVERGSEGLSALCGTQSMAGRRGCLV